MNKILIVTTLAFTLNGCRFVQTKDTYLDEKASPGMKISENLNTPNASSLL
jgi:hypothetical protein